MSKNISLEIIAPSETKRKIIFSTDDKTPLIKGLELENYMCGSCGFILAENIIPNSYKDLILQCPNCKSLNDIPYEGL